MWIKTKLVNKANACVERLSSCFHLIKMSVNLPSFLKARISYQEFTKGLETFLWKDLSQITEIGRGTFGSVLFPLNKSLCNFVCF